MGGLPILSSDTPPRGLLQGAAYWLADSLEDGWRFVRSKNALKRRTQGYDQELALQGSVYNRTGMSVTVSLTAIVWSKALAAWRLDNADRVLGSGAWLYATPVGNLLGSYSRGEFDLTNAARRQESLPRMLEVIREVAIPYLDMALTPGLVAEAFTRGTAGTYLDSLLEWFVSLGLSDTAQALLDKSLDSPAGDRLVSEAAMAEDGIRPRKGAGWVAARLGLKVPVPSPEARTVDRRFPCDAPDLDADGFLAAGGSYSYADIVMTADDAGMRTYFHRHTLESALWTFGEDALVDRVRHGLRPAEVERIGRRHAELIYTADPDLASGHGYAADKAFAMASVEALEGSARPLSRRRRRGR